MWETPNFVLIKDCFGYSESLDILLLVMHLEFSLTVFNSDTMPY